LLKNPKAEWADRTLVHHVGRWGKGKAEDSKFRSCAIQNSRFSLVNNEALYDLQSDPGESKNVIAEHPEVVASLRASYEKWWADVQPLLVNEAVTDIPKMNPMKEIYWKQFGGSPDDKMLTKMAPKTTAGSAEAQTPRKERRKKAVK
jgi:arylsulfatase